MEFNTALRKPHHLRETATPKEVINLICQIRSADPEKSKYEIQAELKDLHGISIGYSTIQKVINRNPKLLNTFHKKKLKAHRKLKIARLRAAKELKEKTPGSLVQAERLIQTVEYEFFNYQDDLLNDDLDEVNKRCDLFNTKYNRKRYHRSLHYQTPSAYITSYLEKGGPVLYPGGQDKILTNPFN